MVCQAHVHVPLAEGLSNESVPVDEDDEEEAFDDADESSSSSEDEEEEAAAEEVISSDDDDLLSVRSCNAWACYCHHLARV
jgi:hypothetical protein